MNYDERNRVTRLDVMDVIGLRSAFTMQALGTNVTIVDMVASVLYLPKFASRL